ncbi:hypothetical protein LSAT2_011731 [Lamellibrachia satsuma]|nr:hypothetical protein LSAT2_011731 [Lamellibrachia satsuma]
MTTLTVFVLAVCVMAFATMTSAESSTGNEIKMFHFTWTITKKGSWDMSCTYTDRSLKVRVQLGQSMSWRTLNGRCVQCFECDFGGMPCEYTLKPC